MSDPGKRPVAADNNAASSEADAIARISDMMQKKLREDTAAGERMPRDAHPKAHGLVQAEFTVAENLPDELRVGVFAQPVSFPAWIRYSNGAPRSATQKPDASNDVRGVGIKLMGVAGEKVLADEKEAMTQDFLLCNHPVFFIRNVPDYEVFLKATSGGNPLPFFFSLWPFKIRFHEAKVLVQALFKKVSSPLAIRYWSQTPYALGDRAVKYSLQPSSTYNEPVLSKADQADADYLRHTMAKELGATDVYLDFMVQLQDADRAQMPVDDPTILWSEEQSPFIKVATIRIPCQKFDTAARNQLAEDLSFTPWHSLPEHQPLGGINRTRRVVYETISRLRHTVNGVMRKEPSGF
ncbi:MAG: catalase family protein [Cyanobacteria bacterium REEB67]|nr:catalase family protein [Cyanobacteria bacterium REEB67]